METQEMNARSRNKLKLLHRQQPKKLFYRNVGVLEKGSFRDLIKVLDPRYVMPSRKHFSNAELPRLYNACRAQVEKDVSSSVCERDEGRLQLRSQQLSDGRSERVFMSDSLSVCSELTVGCASRPLYENKCRNVCLREKFISNACDWLWLSVETLQ
ncbi:hypothetical protein DNTS_028176 [Danionella cerebrum]|uniref:Uncharacterized protein n=1 Tax=Danionella cerebrum TaxID=2873325 RepID=A0A553QR57_9TELE|nr:hypothetical protein DNTS_028176 [Danionella translucida]